MTTVHHLIVGTDDLVPTADQLLEIVEEFQKLTPVFTVPVKVVELQMGLTPSRIMVNAHAKGWTPTEKEIRDLRAMFTFAVADENGSVVATRCGVRAQVVANFLSTEAANKSEERK